MDERDRIDIGRLEVAVEGRAPDGVVLVRLRVVEMDRRYIEDRRGAGKATVGGCDELCAEPVWPRATPTATMINPAARSGSVQQKSGLCAGCAITVSNYSFPLFL